MKECQVETDVFLRFPCRYIYILANCRKYFQKQNIGNFNTHIHHLTSKNLPRPIYFCAKIVIFLPMTDPPRFAFVKFNIVACLVGGSNE